MKKIILLVMILACVSFAQVKTNVTTVNKTIKEVTVITVDSVSLDGFIKRYIDRNSATSTHTLAQIDAAVDKASLAITTGTLTASGIYTTTSTNNIINATQLYYKDLLINGATAIKVLTTEKP